MYQSGDAAEQVVRISLEGAEYAIKLAGSGAKQIAAFLLAAFKSDGTEKTPQTKLKGKERLTTMLKSKSPLKIFGVKNCDLEKFSKEAKRYGCVYCALRDKKAKPNDLVDIMVKAEDAPKIDRILERLEFMSVDRASVESNFAKGNERDVPDVADTENIVDLMIDDEGKPLPEKTEAEKTPETAEVKQQEKQPENPSRAKTDRGVPSEPTLDSQPRTEKTAPSKKPSVKEFLREKVARNKREQDKERAAESLVGDKPKEQRKPNTHIQPQNKRTKKPKSKERN